MILNALIFIVLLIALVTCEHHWFPKYHFAPEKGWMNDPNGLSYFNGYFHLFYQYTPDNPSGGLKHWGHARSKNMLDWERLPIALSPSMPEDIDGIFSGSAVIDNNNLTLIYTGVSGNHQVQCLATSSDGVSFTKKGVIIRKNGIDEHFRDPKAWWQDDAWFVVIGSKFSINGKDRGEIILYKSKDLYNWDDQGRLVESKSGQGYMWECPDFFTLNNKQILIVSPQGIAENGYDYQNLYQSVYFVGTWAPGSSDYKIEKNLREIDHGHDFYAPQTFLAPDDRRIMIGWFGMWESVFPEIADGWATMMTIPRELTLSKSGDLEVRPIREIFDGRKGPLVKKTNFVVDNLMVMEDNVVTKVLNIDYDLSKNTSDNFGIRIGDNSTSKIGVQLYVDNTKGRLFIERYYPEYNITASSRSIPVNLNEPLHLDIFVDRSSVEVFVNDGKAVLSSRIYPNNNERILSFFGKVNVNCYESWSL